MTPHSTQPRARSWALRLCIVGAGVLTIAAPASAQRSALERGVAAYAAEDFAAAREAFDEVFAQPRRALEVSLEAHRYLTALRLRGGATDAAREHARAAVAIDPQVQPPEGSPEGVAGLFRASRLERDRFLQIDAPARPEGGDVVHAYSRVAPEDLSSALHLRCGDAVASAADVAVHLRLPAPGEPTVTCHASLNSMLGGPAFLQSRRTLTYFLEPVRDQTSDDTALIWGLAAGGVGVAIIIASIVIGVAASGSSAPAPDP